MSTLEAPPELSRLVRPGETTPLSPETVLALLGDVLSRDETDPDRANLLGALGLEDR